MAGELTTIENIVIPYDKNCVLNPEDSFEVVAAFVYDSEAGSGFYEMALRKRNGEPAFLDDGICPKGSEIPVEGKCVYEDPEEFFKSGKRGLPDFTCTPSSLSLFASAEANKLEE